MNDRDEDKKKKNAGIWRLNSRGLFSQCLQQKQEPTRPYKLYYLHTNWTNPPPHDGIWLPAPTAEKQFFSHSEFAALSVM